MMGAWPSARPAMFITTCWAIRCRPGPLAPMPRLTWVSALPLPSPYMLFNAHVRSRGLPAVTHVDGTARIQTVDASCGEFFRLLGKFFERTGCPVVLNTSFNGPGEPIVESPADALNF